MRLRVHIIGLKILTTFLLLLINFNLKAEKIGFVNMDSLINNSPQILRARETITTEFEAQYEDIKQKESDLEILENQITKDGAIMSLPELGKLQERARILERQVRRTKEDLKDAISIRNTQILNEIQLDLESTVKKYAIENNYDAILINAILYVSPEMDITQDILKILKEQNSNSE